MNRLHDQIRIFFPDELISDWSCTGQSVRHDEKIRGGGFFKTGIRMELAAAKGQAEPRVLVALR